MASGMQMLAGGGLLLLLALVMGDFKRLNLETASWVSIGAFVYLGLFGSLVGFTAYSWLLNNVTPARAATYAYVNPVVAVLLGWSIGSVVPMSSYRRQVKKCCVRPQAVKAQFALRTPPRSYPTAAH